ncbi:hypothetical protein [Paraburkholderia caribensis]|uniref:hypothetical protein n=1 Tax=Paraburkholderia caribensis TaxID=75105 RepID=UPI00078BF639|nr:hypothetical protein [Paraburkholderia caribensis]AMV44334.1 hypothetical protein ATN79_20540 [Paraburkholderia caribensis]
MGKPYVRELDQFPNTYAWARRQSVEQLERYLQRWAGEHAAIVGSGGSFSAAIAIALFRELAHHSPTSAVTPLEFISLLGRLSPHTLLLSAEGKNKDVLAAASRAANADLAAAAVTLTSDNPLTAFADASRAVRVFQYQMDWIKDGYLATNSLLAMVLLLYRAFFGKLRHEEVMPQLFDRQRLTTRRHQLHETAACLSGVGAREILLLHSPQARPFAVDLESKLAESGLAIVQLVDFRQFAHGRHLQLAVRPSLRVLNAFSTSERDLALATKALLPCDIPLVDVEIEGRRAEDVAVAGLVDAMYMTEALAFNADYDPGNPDVPEFGRAIHFLDPEPLLDPAPAHSIVDWAARRKAACIGTSSSSPDESVLRAAEAYLNRLTSSKIKAVVCDFDGTLCRAEDRFGPMRPEMADVISALLRQGLVVGIASGRGDSLHGTLRAAFEHSLHSSITVGYYSGSYITTLDQPFDAPAFNPEFEELYAWLCSSAYGGHGKPLSELAKGGQFSMRVHDPRHASRLRGSIRSWLNRTGRFTWRVFCSGHSLDVLDASTTKCRVVDHVSSLANADPLHQILRIGDAGHEDGNDFELLGEGLALSCDSVSADLDSCWNFSMPGRNQADATMAYFNALKRQSIDFALVRATLLRDRIHQRTSS